MDSRSSRFLKDNKFITVMKFLSQLQKKHISGKTFLVRIDLNADFKKGTSMFRLEAVIPTLSFLLKNGARKIVVASHRGRPERRAKKESLDIFAPIIAHRTKKEVDFISAYRVGTLADEARKSNAPIVLLENLRFFRGEETNDPSFAKALASCADIYVNDAFAVSHRKNASVCAITDYLPSYSGLLLEKELAHLSRVLKDPEHPFVVLIGGVKISEKTAVIDHLWKLADLFLLGGAAANTFLAAQGVSMGRSVFDKKVIDKMKSRIFSPRIILPVDGVRRRGAVMDIGPETAARYAKIIASAKMILWSGPFGLFQENDFSHGTEMMWSAVLKNKNARVVIGGGETIASLRVVSGFQSIISRRKNIFLSTGGGAMLGYLSGKALPGVVALEKNRIR